MRALTLLPHRALGKLLGLLELVGGRLALDALADHGPRRGLDAAALGASVHQLAQHSVRPVLAAQAVKREGLARLIFGGRGRGRGRVRVRGSSHGVSPRTCAADPTRP